MTNKRSNKRNQRRLATRVAKIANWTVSDFTHSFKAIRNDFFHVKTQRPTNEVEKALFVTSEELAMALSNMQTSNYEPTEVLIRLDEDLINSAYKKTVK